MKWFSSHKIFFIFLGRSALFSFGFLLIFAAANAYYQQRVMKNDFIFTSLNRFREENINPRIIFLGDSHAALDIRSEFLDDGYYNFSAPSEGWREFSLRLRTALKLKKTITHVIIPLDDHAFAPYRAHDVFFTNFLHFSDLDDIKAVFKPSAVTLFKARVSNYLPLVSPGNRTLIRKVTGEDMYAFITRTKNIKSIVIDAWGGIVPTDERIWSEVPERERNEEIASRANKHFRKPLINEELMATFEDFLAYCEKHGVKVIGVRYPVTTDYQQAAKEHGEGLVQKRYQDFSFDGTLDYYHAFDKHQDYFRDPDHLNTKGAVVFSQMLMADLRKTVK
ncbi:MAG: hypothetical protein AAB968_02940 [Patescibacteria group bacterium]